MITEIASKDMPKNIGNYRLVKKIGQGGMSVVYEGFDTRLERSVAIKILHPFLAESDEYRARFLREAQVVARLTHPNIVQIYDMGYSDHDNNLLYIVTELVSGQTLKDWAKKNNILDAPEFAALIIIQIAHALEHAHQKAIIHRDIKPENIMLTTEGQIKLMDFGIASIGSEENLTQAGTLLGSLAHLAPEIINGNKASVASDIYSLSVVFFWLLSKKLPFNGNSPHALLKAIVDQPAPKAQLLSPFVSDSLALLVEKGMNKNPSFRFQSASALISAIQRALKDFGVAIEDKSFSQAVAMKKSLSDIKRTISQQIAQKKSEYEAQKQTIKALELQCRLDALPNSKRPTSNYFFKKTLALSAIFLIAAVAFYLWPKNSSQSLPNISKTMVTQEVIISAKEAQSMLSEPIIETKTEALPQIQSEQEKTPPPIKKEPPKKETISTKSKQKIDVVIWPFANIFIDGKLLAKNQKSISLQLPLGSHKLSFTHKYAATVEKLVKIDKITEPVELSIVLNKTKPAFLVVQCLQDANVAINSSFKGTAHQSTKKPIVITLPDRTHAIKEKVLIYLEGFKPYVNDIEFTAGKIKLLKVNLTPI
ncbi:MAG: serine/threonine protein kinase [Myxococcales bacterium]|nr:serine/threonine protein kinase [Myxococcales bacterium]USN51738.1 MAG: serine/threonine protein kinase [Myxococcales bacterium]